jgi:hypothetical protein
MEKEKPKRRGRMRIKADDRMKVREGKEEELQVKEN